MTTPDDPADSDATRLTPGPPPEDATRIAPADARDDGATRLAPAGDRDDGETRLGPPAPSDESATVLAPTGSSRQVEHDATRLAAADATQLTSSRPAHAGPRPVGESGPLSIGERFGRYTIVRLLGMGGMGAVYQAWDEELEVVVALKVIRPEALRDPEAEREIERRFKRELLLARQVTHKNVVRIHDLGEIRGIKYITMSFVEGTDLSTVVRKEGRLPVDRVLRIMRAVVSGLVAAHHAGVVHRDLKPANIMIDESGDALIMDFGIARSSGTAPDLPQKPGAVVSALSSSARIADATVAGAIVGTVEYMAPEQARGETVDHRADIYTTGLILYDLLAGRRRAEHAGSAVDGLKARMEGRLPPLKSVVPDVPDALAAIVARATDPDPAKRYQNTGDLAAALGGLDDAGKPLPVKRVVGLWLAAAGLIAAIGISSSVWWFTRPEPVATPREAVSVVIADIDNRTGDAALNRTLEPTLRRALEGAGFITAFDRNGIARIVGAAPPEKLDEAAARELAVKHALGVVLSGAVEAQGRGFAVSLKAARPVTGEVITEVRARAASLDQVVPTATSLVSSIRKALGDATSDADPIFAKTSLSAASLEVVRLYAAAMEATSNNQFAQAREHLTRAVELDPKFGVGYLVLAGISRNLGRVQDAEQYIKQALSHLDGMTEREQLTTRGMYYRIIGDYKQCVSEHTELIARYAADVVGRNQLALCASYLRDFARARDEMREVVKILPSRAVFRDNLALYSNYASDFETGESEARTVIEMAPADAYARLALAMAQTGLGQIAEARTTYEQLATLKEIGATFAASGLADLASYEGRYSEAARLYQDGAAADLAAKNPDRAAAKFAAQAHAHLWRGQRAAAVASAERALGLSKAPKIRFLAARVFVEAGQPHKAKPLMEELAAEIQPERQAYGKIIEAMLVMQSPDSRPAIKLLTEANDLMDTWIGRFELGRAFLATGQFPQADGEFARCLKRRGEAISLFLDEEPTAAFLPAVHYYQARARESLGVVGFAESYRTYISMREKAGEDPLVADARKRIK